MLQRFSLTNACNCALVSGFRSSFVSAGRTVYLYQVNGCPSLSSMTTFCTSRGLQWWRPVSTADANLLITTAYNIDAHHTWINGTFFLFYFIMCSWGFYSSLFCLLTLHTSHTHIYIHWIVSLFCSFFLCYCIIVYGLQTSSSAIGGYSFTVDSPSCSDFNNGANLATSWGTFRKWSCSMCQPANYGGVACCWDSSHAYDWLVCQGPWSTVHVRACSCCCCCCCCCGMCSSWDREYSSFDIGVKLNPVCLDFFCC